MGPVMLSAAKHLSASRTQMLSAAKHDRRDRPGSKNLRVKARRDAGGSGGGRGPLWASPSPSRSGRPSSATIVLNKVTRRFLWTHYCQTTPGALMTF